MNICTFFQQDFDGFYISADESLSDWRDALPVWLIHFDMLAFNHVANAMLLMFFDCEVQQRLAVVVHYIRITTLYKYQLFHAFLDHPCIWIVKLFNFIHSHESQVI